MNRNTDYASTYRSLQNRRHRNTVKGFRKLRKRDLWYFGMSVLIIGAFINSAINVRIVKVPQIQVVHAEEPIINFPLQHPFVMPSPTPTPNISTDTREANLASFFRIKGSPLADEAQTFIDVADHYGLDYTLMPAISWKESQSGLAMPQGSYNPFGLGGTRFMWFSSFDQAIWYEGSLLSNNYRSQANYAIGYKYCPPSECASDWADVVTATQYEIINK